MRATSEAAASWFGCMMTSIKAQNVISPYDRQQKGLCEKVALGLTGELGCILITPGCRPAHQFGLAGSETGVPVSVGPRPGKSGRSAVLRPGEFGRKAETPAAK